MYSDSTMPAGSGVYVFGSALIHVAPDSATIRVAVSRLEELPKGAFSKAHIGARAVHDYLKSEGINEVRSSRITLAQDFQYSGGVRKFSGYEAKIGYSLVVRDLDLVEDILTGLIDAGANELASVTFETSRLREVREEARKRAIAAARAKAEVYATASGIALGNVVLIEDVNPEVLTGRSESHVHREPALDDSVEIGAVDPGAITVGAAVKVVYAINR